jgi:thioester reductase-like protein
MWTQLADQVGAIYHNGAAVNYLMNYAAMRSANVGGTNRVLELAFKGRRKVFNHISTTFIHGWSVKSVLLESDQNESMERLDFGYSQSKWVSEQVVYDAQARGADVRVFRPSLITPTLQGHVDSPDIMMRAIAFMIKYGIGTSSANQISFVPADVTANNIVAIARQRETLGGTFHVTQDDYFKMEDVLNVIAAKRGVGFTFYSLHDFVAQMIRRCTRTDSLYPLVDFFVNSIEDLSAMEFKRYDSREYQKARDASPCGMPDPSMNDIVDGILRFLERSGMV